VQNSYNGYYYWFSPDGLPLAETNSSGTAQNEYIYFNGGRTARRDSSGNVYYYFSDQVGTAQVLTNSSGTVCYDSDNTPFGYEMAYTTSCPQDYQFAGMELDGGTGNYHTWFRYYEPNLGRWMTPDPLSLGVTDPSNPQSFNLYSYVINDPTTLNDPLGLCDCEGGGAGFLGGCGGGGGGPGHVFIPPRLIPSPGPAPSPTSDPESGGAPSGNGQFPGGPAAPSPYPCNSDWPCPSAAGLPPWWPIPPGLAVISLPVIFHAQGSAKGPRAPLWPSPIPSGLILEPSSSLFAPDVPAASAWCSAYRDGTGAGAILYQICMNTPSGRTGVGRWGNCVRGNLLREYVPNDNPADLIFRYGAWDHFYYFTACAVQ
jgi:RHS repeat-associated protein